MGGGGRGSSRTQRRHFRQGRENVWKRSRSENRSQPRTEENNDESNRTPTWEPFATQNEAFNDYYKEQEIVPLEEWGTFIEYLRKPLPAAFRVNASSQFSADIRSQLEDEFMKSFLSDVSDDGEMDGIRPLPWYPDNLAWQSNYSRMQLRKNQTLERFHEFLKQENEIGNITRQEAVSMVPPLLLDVHPDHFVLDMCAAPGSKTFQLLEIIYQSVKLGVLPSGMVIANDLDVQRCNLLIHQTKRMCTANLIVTNHEAQQFPGCRFNKRSSNVIEMGNLKEPHVNKLLFDRVLCDVPCSGDGTLRKAPDIWRRWNAGIGNGLHSLQVQIALRGISLLKVGGRMVYSTCSMNPVENEAVVAEILRRCGGTVELLDVSNELPQLVRRPGLKKWKVRDKGIWLASYKEVREFRRAAILSSMFPSGRSSLESEDNNSSPTGSTADVLDEASDLPLERCMRIVPHDQNSGAFFIAVLHKVSSLSICDKPMDVDGHLSLKNDDSCEKKIPEGVKEDTNELDITTEDATDNRSSSTKTALDVGLPENAHLQTPSELDPSEENKHGESLPAPKACPAEGGRRKLQIQGKWKGVDPVVFFNDEAIIDKIRTFYGIDGSFPLDRHLVTRNSDTDHVKRIYYISRSVKDALELNLLVGEQLKIASIGLKMFERQTSKDGAASPCGFRISSEGLPLILPYVTKQILSACLADFNHLLQYKSIKFDNFVDAEFGVAASNLMLGCCVVVLRKGDQTLTDPIQPDESTIAIGCWKGRASLNVMVTAIECRELLERLSKRRERESGPSIVEGDTVKDMNDI